MTTPPIWDGSDPRRRLTLAESRALADRLHAVLEDGRATEAEIAAACKVTKPVLRAWARHHQLPAKAVQMRAWRFITWWEQTAEEREANREHARTLINDMRAALDGSRGLP